MGCSERTFLLQCWNMKTKTRAFKKFLHSKASSTYPSISLTLICFSRIKNKMLKLVSSITFFQSHFKESTVLYSNSKEMGSADLTSTRKRCVQYYISIHKSKSLIKRRLTSSNPLFSQYHEGTHQTLKPLYFSKQCMLLHSWIPASNYQY